jgi:hypothetical protein
LATLTVVALVPASVSLVAPLSLTSAAEPQPVKPDVATHRLATGSAVPASARVVAPADASKAAERAGGRSADVKSVSQGVALPGDLSVVGVTWEPGTGRGASVQYRTLEHGSWSAWEFVDVDPEHAPDAAEGRRAGVRQGSDPVVVTHAEQVQVRVLGPRKAAAPTDAELMVVDPGQSAADETVGQRRSGAAVAAAKRPYIYTRAQWGADETLRDPAGPSYGAVRAAFVHHTAGSNSYTSDQVPGIIRGIYAYHVNGNGWSDIGYNFLVDRFGRTWEGRYGGTTRPVIGAHAYGVNSYAFGVSVLGNFETTAPPSSVIAAVSQLIGWKAQIHEFNPGGKALIGGNVYNGINGHRDAVDNSTECPGIYLYNQLPAIRNSVMAQVKGVPSLSIDRDLDNHNDADVVATNSAGDLLLYSTTNTRGVTGPTTLEAGTWTGRDEVHVVGDWNGDGAVDLMSRVQATGALELHPGKGDGTIDAPKQIGNGWSGFTALIAPGDWNGDGRVDLLARLGSDNSLRLYPGNGTGGFNRPSVIGSGWGTMRLISGVGDWDGDGARDLLAVEKSGWARIYRGNGSGGFSGYINLPGDWSTRQEVIGVGDASADMRVDVLSVDADGKAELGARGATAGEIVWSPVDMSFAGVEPYTG